MAAVSPLAPLTSLDVVVAHQAGQFGFDTVVDVKRVNGGRFAFADLFRRPVFIRPVAKTLMVYAADEWATLDEFLTVLLQSRKLVVASWS
jgi:hypothetical protein